MNKLFGKSKRSKEKDKRIEERKEEDDILFGRARNRDKGGLSQSISSTSASSVAASSAAASSVSDNATLKRNTVPKIAEGTTYSDIGDSEESRHSMSTSYYRGESFEAVSKSNHFATSVSSPEFSSAAAGWGAADSGGNRKSDPYDSHQSKTNDECDIPQEPSASAAASRGKTSGMSQEEIDYQAKRRLKDERKRIKDERPTRSGNLTSFDERLKRNVMGEGDLENDYENGEDEHSSRKPRHSRSRKDGRHRKSDRKHRSSHKYDHGEDRGEDPKESESRRHAGREHRSSNISASSATSYSKNGEDDEVEQRRRRQREQTENDRKLKASVRQQRDAVKDIRAGAQTNRADVDDEVEQRRRRQREQSENDRKLKASVRQQRDAVKELRAGAQTNRADVDDEVEQRRRRQREQSENDRKLKASVRQQRDAVKDIRAGAHTNRADVDDEVEQRRRRQREQSENDRKLKASVRQQRDAVKELRASAQIGAHINRQSNEDGELEQRRRRQRDQEENDKKMKASIRQQRDAVKELRASIVLPTVDEGFEERRRSQREQSGNDRKEPYASSYVGNNSIKHRYASFSDNSGIDEDDPFESALKQGGQLMPANKQEAANKREADDEPDIQQNLIDLHLAQFRATTKANIDEAEEYDSYDVDPNAALADFEEEEFLLNSQRRLSRRVSTTTMKINAWNQKYTLKKALELAERTPEMEWASSFYRCDPRWQIAKFFDEVAREGGQAPMDENLAASPLANLFNKANVFTVWRPTSDEAIKNMMLGIATGKGLDIKGKSAKRGNISSYVPFIQIYEEPHKEHIRALIKDGRTVRIFYQSEEARNEAHEMILDIKDFMLFAAEDAMRVLSDEYADPAEQELAMKHLMYDDTNLNVKFVDTYIDSEAPVFGLDITERLFWESYVMMQDCSRPEGSDWDIGRKSEPTFMDMNFKAIRHEPAPGDPRAVVYQMSEHSPMEPRMLLMAYEEFGRVKPVVSDFDCFLLGSRGVKYESPIPQDQIDLVQWSVKNISEVLDERTSDSKSGWMEAWFKVLKKAALKGFYPKTPKYGNGDPKSYEITSIAVSRLQGSGCVRHGAECFNWFFPQEVDDQLLVISDTLPGNVKWKKVNPHELQDLLITKIDEGFTFPINPKWVLCDPGWRRVYDKLLASQKPNVQDSINCWLPPETGLREEIDLISARHPLGFEGTHEKTEGTEVMDKLEDELERYLKIQRAWRKLRLVLFWIRFVREKRREREERLMEAELDSQW